MTFNDTVGASITHDFTVLTGRENGFGTTENGCRLYGLSQLLQCQFCQYARIPLKLRVAGGVTPV